jgi:hypothetical protein
LNDDKHIIADRTIFESATIRSTFRLFHASEGSGRGGKFFFFLLPPSGAASLVRRRSAPSGRALARAFPPTGRSLLLFVEWEYSSEELPFRFSLRGGSIQARGFHPPSLGDLRGPREFSPVPFPFFFGNSERPLPGGLRLFGSRRAPVRLP